MTEEEIYLKIKEVFIENAGLTDDEIQKTSTFSDLDLDSLDALTIVTDLEEKFDILIEDDKVANIDSVQDVIDNVMTAINT